jgi:hypothetical protein
VNTPNANSDARRAAIEEFLDYVMEKPGVKVTTYVEILDWMRNPTKL